MGMAAPPVVADLLTGVAAKVGGKGRELLGDDTTVARTS